MRVSRRQALGMTAAGLAGGAWAKPCRAMPIDIRWSGERQPTALTMAPTEHRGFHISLKRHRDPVTIHVQQIPKSFSCDLAKLNMVFLPDGQSIVDPLEPLGKPAVLDEGGTDFFLRLSVGQDADIGRHAVTFELASSDADGGVTQIDFVVDVVPLDLPVIDDNLTIQGSLWVPGLDDLRASFDPTRVMAAMRADDFNAVALLRGNDDIPALTRLALNEMGFKTVRLPNHRLLNRRFRPTASDMQDYLIKTDAYFDQFDPLFDHPGWRERLIVKLWDEPQPFNYQDVVESHRYIRERRPWLRMELTEEPGPELGDIADIWIVHGEAIDEAPIEDTKARGQDVWIYGNALHSLGRRDVSMRTIGWLIWRYRLQGYHFWSVNWWKEDPWSPTPISRQAMYKRGTLFFPSRTNPGDVQTTLRLQSFRDGLQDWRWLSWLDQQALVNGPASAEAQFAQQLRGNVDWTGALNEALDVKALHAQLVAFVVDRVGA